MANKIRPNQNQRSQGVPVDDEIEAVLVAPFVFDSVTQEWVPQTPAGAVGLAGEVFIKRQSDATVINPARDETLVQARDHLNTVRTLLTSIEAKDFATQVTLVQVRDHLDTVETLLAARASEATLIQVRDHLDTVETQLGALVAKDYATQTTLASVLTSVDGVETKLDALQVELEQKTEPTNRQVVVQDRPAQKTGRTYVHIVGRELTGTTLMYTVTAGKKLFVTSISFVARNQDTTVSANCAIRDNGLDRLPVTFGTAVAGQLTPQVSMFQDFSQPMEFTTNVEWQELTGDVVISLTLIGYEE